MSLLVTGSIGIDTVTTPYGLSENCLGGSAIYFSLAASFFCPVRLTGVIGSDCPFDLLQVFSDREVDLAGLEKREFSRTFRWKGSYHDTMNEAITDNVELNVLSEAPAVLPESYKDSKYVFLANTDPVLQQELLGQLDGPGFVAADTMNCWIQGKGDDLRSLLKKIDALIINAGEARMLAGESNLTKAGELILGMGPSVVIIKKGDSGSIMFSSKDGKFILPAYPSAEVKDPTGAGDSFAGGLMGYLAKAGKVDFETLKTAIGYGTVMASFTISDFSLGGLESVGIADIEGRLESLRELTQF